MAKLSIGDEAAITLVSGDTVQGTLRYVAPAADSATRTFRIEIEIPNPDRSLREGLTAICARATHSAAGASCEFGCFDAQRTRARSAFALWMETARFTS